MSNGFRIGNPGKTYGLIKPVLKVNPAFVQDEDEEDNDEARTREAERQKKMRKAALEHEKILKEDSSAFDYDGHYDSMKTAAEEAGTRKKAATAMNRKPKYMDDILKKAKEREREQAVIYEKMLIKEQEKEIAEFGDKEKFVTKAYLDELQKNKRWQEEDAKKEDKMGSVEKTGDMSGFYSNFLTNNVSMGTAKKTTPKPAEETKEPQAPARPARDTKDLDPDSGAVSDSLSRFLSGGSKPKNNDTSTPSTSIPESKSKDEEKDTKDVTSNKRTIEKISQVKEETPEEKEKREKEEQEKKLARKNDDDAVSAAKARYLARKQQQQNKPV